MKILHLSTWETGGAAKATTRLSTALNNLGVDSQILHMSSRLPAYLDAAIAKLTHTVNPIFHSYNYFGEDISKKIAEFKPDILHIHWIGAGFIRPESLAKYGLPIVWTLHDLWPLCGGEHLPSTPRFQAGYFPGSRPTGEWGLDLNRLVWERKLKSFKDLNLTYVAPSRYVREIASSAKSIQGHHLEYIANGLDVEIYKPNKNKHNKDKSIIFFAAMNPQLDPNKGYVDFVKSIALLSPNIRDRVAIKTIGGKITTEIEMARLYQSATVTVVPSRIENLSFVTMESLACGTPVVAYKVGGIPDLVEHGKNGYLAKPYDIKDLSRGIEKIITSPVLQKEYGKYGREKIVKSFNLSTVAKKYLELYESLI